LNFFRRKRKLVIFGLEDFAEIAYEYFTNDSNYEVVAFTAHRKYLTDETKFGKPVFAFEDILNHIDPTEFRIFVAITYFDMNSLREKILNECLELGFQPASYVSSKCFIWENVKLGNHVFIFENNTIQPFAQIGDNVILWSGNHIGHHSHIDSNVFITSHVVVSGWVYVGDHSFVGVNATIANGITIGSYNWINAGTYISKNTKSHTYFSEGQSRNADLNLESLNAALSKKSDLRKE
jgi:sugar O-acyltransferase (sialic acid O-acetyltransferase NeuD family)